MQARLRRALPRRRQHAVDLAGAQHRRCVTEGAVRNVRVMTDRRMQRGWRRQVHPLTRRGLRYVDPLRRRVRQRDGNKPALCSRRENPSTRHRRRSNLAEKHNGCDRDCGAAIEPPVHPEYPVRPDGIVAGPIVCLPSYSCSVGRPALLSFLASGFMLTTCRSMPAHCRTMLLCPLWRTLTGLSWS